MSTVNRILQQVEVLEARAKEESNPALGIEAASRLEKLASEQAEGRYSFLAQALSLRLLYAADANETLAAFQHAAAAIEAGPHVHVAALKLARRALAGVLSAHEGTLQKPMVAWLKAADVNVRPEDLTDAH